MKSLDQLDGKLDQAAASLAQLDVKAEKRVPISSLPFTISQSGSYYLSGNLEFTATTGNAITISASNVTLDLMGFTLSSTAGVTGEAIHLNGGLRNIAVKNGVIAGNTIVTVTGVSPNWTWSSAPGGFSRGIWGASPANSNCQLSELRISGCRADGVGGFLQVFITKVSAFENGGRGIAGTDGSVTDSTALNNNSDGIELPDGSVTNCTVTFNSGFGIDGKAGIPLERAVQRERH